MRRVAPAVALYFLSPLVAEFLLGDFTLTTLPLVVVLAPMYGGGALVIREIVRRTGRDWSSILLLSLAFGVLEEGITTQSLFDPGYAHAHLLDKGFVPALGIAVPWTIYVLSLHTVWSISVPVALMEEASGHRTTPWLADRGLAAAILLFGIGVVGTTLSSYGHDHYLASVPQLLTVLVVVAALVIAAFRRPRTSRPSAGPAPRPWSVLVVVLATGAAIQLGMGLPTPEAVATMLGALLATTVAVAVWSRRTGWGAHHRVALAAAGLLTYAWHSFFTSPLSGGGAVVTPVSHVVFALAAIVLLAIVVLRVREPAQASMRSSAMASAPSR